MRKKFRGCINVKKNAVFLFVLAAWFLLAGCRAKTAPGGELVRDPVEQAESSDESLAAIAEKARETLPEFFERLENPAKGESCFMIKCPFPAEAGSGFGKEYLWLKDIRFKDGVYTGVVANRPFYTSGLEAGTTTLIDIDQAADWMYLRDGKIEGGLSIRYFIEKIPELDRDTETDSLLKLFERE